MSTVNCTISFMDGEQMRIAWDRKEDASIRGCLILDKILASVFEVYVQTHFSAAHALKG